MTNTCLPGESIPGITFVNANDYLSQPHLNMMIMSYRPFTALASDMVDLYL